jgi:regulator of replication initiation timing
MAMMEKRLSDLQSENASLRAENASVRAENERYKHTLGAELYSLSQEQFIDDCEAKAWVEFASAHTSSQDHPSVDLASTFANRMMVEFRKRRKIRGNP